jgi:hypothetical protein
MSAKSARRFLEHLVSDRGLLKRIAALGVSESAFDELTRAEGYGCSLSEVQAAAGDEPAPSVAPEVWLAALIEAARGDEPAERPAGGD